MFTLAMLAAGCGAKQGSDVKPPTKLPVASSFGAGVQQSPTERLEKSILRSLWWLETSHVDETIPFAEMWLKACSQGNTNLSGSPEAVCSAEGVTNAAAFKDHLWRLGESLTIGIEDSKKRSAVFYEYLNISLSVLGTQTEVFGFEAPPQDDDAGEEPEFEFQSFDDGHYLRIGRLDESTVLSVRDALTSIRRTDRRPVLVDLRRNSGGLFRVSAEVATLFADNGAVVAKTWARSGAKGPLEQTEVVADESDRLLRDRDVLVMVDGGTAAGAELIALALRDHCGAQVLGQPSVGHRYIAHQYDLPDGHKLLLAVGFWVQGGGDDLPTERRVLPDRTVTWRYSKDDLRLTLDQSQQ